MGTSLRSVWEGFLPKRAIVMARRRPPDLPVDSMAKIETDLQGCLRCPLCEKRNTLVFGEGNPQARLVFIGDSPGPEEDLQGRPFMGQAGELLNRMIQAIGLKRGDIYLINLVKCKPAENCQPNDTELTSCSPFLYRQLDVIQPQVVVALGEFAVQTLMQTEAPISELRGRFHPYRGTKLMPTFHPSDLLPPLLKNPNSKKEAWLDLQAVAHELGLEIPKRS